MVKLDKGDKWCIGKDGNWAFGGNICALYMKVKMGMQYPETSIKILEREKDKMVSIQRAFWDERNTSEQRAKCPTEFWITTPVGGR